jgi:hypothetical protein
MANSTLPIQVREDFSADFLPADSNKALAI